MSNTQHKITCRNILIDIYASIDVELLVGGIQGDFRQGPGLTLHDLIDLAARSQRKARGHSTSGPGETSLGSPPAYQICIRCITM